MLYLQSESTFRYVRHIIRSKVYKLRKAQTTLYETPMISSCGLYTVTYALN